jgi:hypothetical protein
MFRAPKVSFLGYKTTSADSHQLGERIICQHDCHPPKIASQLRLFLGMLNFYRLFLPHLATHHAPLQDVLSGPRDPITWTSELNKASLTRATLLAHLDSSVPHAFITDASTAAVVVSLQ